MKKLLKHKNKIITGALIIAVLAFVYWWGGNSSSLHGWNSNEASATTEKYVTAETAEKDKQTQMPDKETKPIENTETQEAVSNDESNPSKPLEKSENYSQERETKPDQSTGKYEYQTNPVPEERPAPVNPADSEITKKELSCTISVRCDIILRNISMLEEEKVDIVPKDGVIFKEKEVTFYEGESVFNVLLREMKKHKIHLEYMSTPIYNSAYIEGIANLYEMDCGELSGWVYKVNDWFPNYGSSRYVLRQGDKIEWLYTCDLGRDVGSSSGMQRDE